MRKARLVVLAALIAVLSLATGATPARAAGGTVDNIGHGVIVHVTDWADANGYALRDVGVVKDSAGVCATIRWMAGYPSTHWYWLNTYVREWHTHQTVWSGAFSPFFKAVVIVHDCNIPVGGVPPERWWTVYHIEPLNQPNHF